MLFCLFVWHDIEIIELNVMQVTACSTPYVNLVLVSPGLSQGTSLSPFRMEITNKTCIS